MTSKKGLNGSHFEFLLSCGASLDDVLALASAALDLRGISAEEEAPPSPVAPTVRSPRGIVAPATPIHVVVAA